MSTNPPDGQSPMLGLKPLQDATEKFAHATSLISGDHKKLVTELGQLTKALNGLSAALGNSGGVRAGNGSGPAGSVWAKLNNMVAGSGLPGTNQHGPQQAGGQTPRGGARTPTGGHSYGTNGGGSTFGGMAAGAAPAGGHGPGYFARTMAAVSGTTPKSWGTQYNRMEAGLNTLRWGAGIAAQRGVDQMDAQVGIGAHNNLLNTYGSHTQSQVDRNGVLSSVLGASRTTPATYGGIGINAQASVQNAQDAMGGWSVAAAYSGGMNSNSGQKRYDALKNAAAGLGYANVGMGWSKSTQLVGNMMKPSNRLNMMLMGLPDPVASDGSYKGNAAFYSAFLKRIYQGRKAVPENVFSDDFREGGVGLENLRMIVGEEGAQAMLPYLAGYNRATAQGKDTKDFDEVQSKSNLAGDKYDKFRKINDTKYGIKDQFSKVQERANAKSRASELTGNEEYMDALDTSSSAMHTFSEAVAAFVNAPIIGDIKNFFKGMAAGFSGAGDMPQQMMINGQSYMLSQGDAPAGGASAPVLSGGLPPGGGAGSSDIEAQQKRLASLATSYATGSRKYKYSMRYRDEDGYFDCSSFVSRVYSQLGYKVGPITTNMWSQGEHVDWDDLQPGDILLWARGKPGAASGAAEHTEMYIGNGKTVGTSSQGKNGNTIQIQQFRRGDWDDARRIVGSGSKRGKATKETSPDGGGGDVATAATDSADSADSSGSTASTAGYSGGGGGGGGGSMGLGSPNAAAYSTSELSALAGILAGGGGGGGGGGVVSGAAGDAATSEEELPQELRGTRQEPSGKDSEVSTALSSKDKKRLGGLKDAPVNPDRHAKRRGDPSLTRAGNKLGFGGDLTLNYAPAGHPAANTGRNKGLAKRMLKAQGWSDKEWSPLEKLWTKESGWSEWADNDGSDAYGIPQALPAWKMSSAGEDWRVNPATQIKWGMGYIKDRYGSPTKAWAHSVAKGWYDSGAWQVPDDQEAVVHKGEMIIPSAQAQTIRDALIQQNLGGAVTGNGGTSSTGAPGTGGVTLNFGPGSVVLTFGAGTSPETGKSAASAFIKELERKELYQQIARGGVKTIGAR
ncbi:MULTISPECIES: NlpC/P60 family protein [Streptosporangium]|uniref:Cell wall-associated NlpC family hydrolase n=1 Tax=Streptosporangium brasiliense TaxID=47480 RepID=A0ABT9RNB1_9ACTN|nr:NlpC/P60 family protein [Streptosporangium brasiliense]MDP9870321.1 cell wall-associated NlpC family hydrolase [Streptosporangium brasiliense]